MLQPLIASFAVLLLFGAAVYAQVGPLPRAPLEERDVQDDGALPQNTHHCWIEDRPGLAHRGCEKERS